MFELVYTLYCLNSKKGVIHGDLHLNNFTVHPLYFTEFKNPDELKNPSMLYVLDKNHYYLFPSRQYHIVVIDFSRSLIRPSLLDSYENFDILAAKKLKLDPKGRITLIKPEERAEFFREQVIAVVGGGPTGVEMAGALAELQHGPLHNDEENAARHIDIYLIYCLTKKTKLLVFYWHKFLSTFLASRV